MKRLVMAAAATALLATAAPAIAAPNFPEQPTDRSQGTETACAANLQQGIHGRGHTSEQGVENQFAVFSDACFGL